MSKHKDIKGSAQMVKEVSSPEGLTGGSKKFVASSFMEDSS